MSVILFNNMSTYYKTLFTNTSTCTMYVFIALFEKSLRTIHVCLLTQQCRIVISMSSLQCKTAQSEVRIIIETMQLTNLLKNNTCSNRVSVVYSCDYRQVMNVYPETCHRLQILYQCESCIELIFLSLLHHICVNNKYYLAGSCYYSSMTA